MKIVDYLMIGATIRIGQEMLCLPYAGFLWGWSEVSVYGSQVFEQASMNYGNVPITSIALFLCSHISLQKYT